MCQFKSGLLFKNKIILTPDGNESHSDLLESLGIEDNHLNASKKFVRVELIPPNGNKFEDINKWTYKVDQDIVPDWYEKDPKKYEEDFRTEVKEYMFNYVKNNNLVKIADYYWTPIKRDGNRIYYLMNGFMMKSEFGKNNNYATSYIREKLNNSDLAKQLKEEFGDKLVPITTNLLSLDGLDDYGKAEVDILAIPTIDLYRECRKKISKFDSWWWLATPDSTPSGYGSHIVQCVNSCGNVSYSWYSDCGSVRPFFVLEVDDKNDETK